MTGTYTLSDKLREYAECAVNLDELRPLMVKAADEIEQLSENWKRDLALYDEALELVKTAELVGYYFGLQRALNKGPHTCLAEELEAEMAEVLLKMPLGIVDVWPKVIK